MISLLAGKPNSATFPLTSVAIKARSPADPSAETMAELTGAALAEGLQYGPTAGLPGLIGWIYGLQEREHGRRQGEGWRVSVGSGSQDVLHKVGLSLYGLWSRGVVLTGWRQAILALVNPGEPVLVERPLYA